MSGSWDLCLLRVSQRHKKDKRQPMGKGKTVLKMGREQYSTGTDATVPELVLS